MAWGCLVFKKVKLEVVEVMLLPLLYLFVWLGKELEVTSTRMMWILCDIYTFSFLFPSFLIRSTSPLAKYSFGKFTNKEFFLSKLYYVPFSFLFSSFLIGSTSSLAKYIFGKFKNKDFFLSKLHKLSLLLFFLYFFSLLSLMQSQTKLTSLASTFPLRWLDQLWTLHPLSRL